MQCHDKKYSVKTLTEDEDQSTEYIRMPPPCSLIVSCTHNKIHSLHQSKIISYMVEEHIWLASTLVAWTERICELFMNNILYFCEQLEISIWQHQGQCSIPYAYFSHTRMGLSRQNRSPLKSVRPGQFWQQKWSPGPILAEKTVPPDHFCCQYWSPLAKTCPPWGTDFGKNLSAKIGSPTKRYNYLRAWMGA